MADISQEEKGSFNWGGQRARPRKGIERSLLADKTFLKPPGSCMSKWPKLGVGIDIECCERCNIYILDACEQVQISECVRCRIVIGPCVGSVMIFDCVDCTVAVAAKQVRLRDCSGCELRSYAPTEVRWHAAPREPNCPLPQTQSGAAPLNPLSHAPRVTSAGLHRHRDVEEPQVWLLGRGLPRTGVAVRSRRADPLLGAAGDKDQLLGQDF
jgi:hypothetical protein